MRRTISTHRGIKMPRLHCSKCGKDFRETEAEVYDNYGILCPGCMEWYEGYVGDDDDDE
jgi:formylmethanofuran dehydrogenase subunit E